MMGEYVDPAAMAGSRRHHQRPVITPEAYNQPPPPMLGAPSKKRKQSIAPVPSDAPFDMAYFSGRVPVRRDGMQEALEAEDALLLLG